MAEAIDSEDSANNIPEATLLKCLNVHYVDSHPECSVCLQPCLQPVQLTCTHIFCFLCAKGFAFRSKKCALCRSDIDMNYFIDPVTVKVRETSSKTSHENGAEESFQWFYEGRNGWWQYDERTSLNLEEYFKSEIRSCEVMIAGFSYIVDFEDMIQYRKNNILRRRRVKRDRSNADRKGVAGLKVNTAVIQTCDECGKLINQDGVHNRKCLDCTRACAVATEEVEHVEGNIAVIQVESSEAQNQEDNLAGGVGEQDFNTEQNRITLETQ